jgi:probable phosphoglycerate mutase
MRLYLIRHADPDYPNNTITDIGHREAQALATRMSRLGLHRIYSSPLGRARDTARYTAAATGLGISELPWTAELQLAPIQDASGESTAAWNIPGEVVRQGGPEFEQIPEFDGFDHRARQQELASASDAFLGGLGYVRDGGVYRAVRPNAESIAVFCHAGFGLSWLAHLLQIPVPLAWCGFFLAPSSVTTILMEIQSPGVAVPRVLGVGDTSHIYADGLSESRRGLRANDH